jgi:capsular polysaccharide biosynthesis protein
MEQQFIDDEIDLLEYMKVVIKYKKFLFGFVFFCLISCFLFNTFSAPRYHVRSTFFIPAESGSAGGALMGYAKMFGVGGGGGNIGGYVKSLVESKRMKYQVADDLVELVKKSSYGKDLKGEKPMKETLGVLNLGKRFKMLEDKNGVFSISYMFEDPDIAIKVIEQYLSNIVLFNKQLEITAQKNVITILDEPEFPEHPSWPKKNFNYVLTLMSSGFFGVLLIFVFDYFRKLNR